MVGVWSANGKRVRQQNGVHGICSGIWTAPVRLSGSGMTTGFGIRIIAVDLVPGAMKGM
jgi:hypothetical protein